MARPSLPRARRAPAPPLALAAILAALIGPALAHPPVAQAPATGTPAPTPAPAPAKVPAAAGEIVTIRPAADSATRQGLRQFVGISGANSGARGLSLNRVVIPPGGRAQPHRHLGSESAIYLLRGRVQTFYGECLEKSAIHQAGDFLFIPAGLPHMPVNLSATEAAIALVARNDPNEQEQVELIAPPGSGGALPGCPPAGAR